MIALTEITYTENFCIHVSPSFEVAEPQSFVYKEKKTIETVKK